MVYTAYTGTFKSYGNVNTYRLNILQTGSTSTTTMRLDQNPIVITMPELDSKYVPVRGSGAVINILSETSSKYLGLFTPKIFNYPVEILKNSSVMWRGYLDSEQYTEDFSSNTNYGVTFTASDLAPLDRISLNIEADFGDNYIISYFDLIKYIFTKLNLGFNYYFNIPYSASTITIGTTEICLHKMYINLYNFYDEDQKPMTLKDILASVLKQFNAFCIQYGGDIYFQHVDSQNNSSNTFKKYSNTFTYVSTGSVTGNLGDISTIKYADTISNFTVVPAFNNIKLKYSPYYSTQLIDWNANYVTYSGTSVVKSGNADHPATYGWKEELFTVATEAFTSNGAKLSKLTATGSSLNYETESFLKITGNTDTLAFGFRKKLPYLPYCDHDKNYNLKVSVSAYFRSKDDYMNDAEGGLTHGKLLKLGAKVILHDRELAKTYYLNVSGRYWQEETSNNIWDICYGYANYDDNAPNIADQWVLPYNNNHYFEGSFFIPLWSNRANSVGNLVRGELEFQIMNRFAALGSDYSDYTSSIRDVRIRSIKVEVVDGNNNSISLTDDEYNLALNSSYYKEYPAISLIGGSNVSLIPSCRAAILYRHANNTFRFLNSVRYKNTTDRLENLVLQQTVVNYSGNTAQLNCVLNASLANNIGYLTYNNYLSGKKMVITAYDNNLAEETIKLVLQEIKPNNL